MQKSFLRDLYTDVKAVYQKSASICLVTVSAFLFYFGGHFSDFAKELHLGPRLVFAATQPTSKPVGHSKAFTPVATFSTSGRLAFSDVESVSAGGGIGMQLFYHFTERIRVGGDAGWSRHAFTAQGMDGHFTRVGSEFHILFDLLPVIPFFQSGFGVQMLFGTRAFQMSPDIHFGIGFDVPVTERWQIGLAWHMFFPLQGEHFPISKSLHLRVGLVF